MFSLKGQRSTLLVLISLSTVLWPAFWLPWDLLISLIDHLGESSHYKIQVCMYVCMYVKYNLYVCKIQWLLSPRCPSHRSSHGHYSSNLSTNRSSSMRPWGSETPVACPERPKHPRAAPFQTLCYVRLSQIFQRWRWPPSSYSVKLPIKSEKSNWIE